MSPRGRTAHLGSRVYEEHGARRVARGDLSPRRSRARRGGRRGRRLGRVYLRQADGESLKREYSGGMKFITTRTHGMLDYGVGALLIAAPWLFGFANEGPETRIFVALGIAAFVYSLFTRYELGLVKVLPFRAHLILDLLSGLLLAASPWLFDFAERVYWPHVIFGLVEIGAALMTHTHTTVADHPAAHSGRAAGI